MRVAIVSTPFVPVPPVRYGGTELIVAELCAGLSAARDEVVLFATGDSRPGVELRARFSTARWPPDARVELAHAAFAVEEILRDARGFDVIHAHLPSLLAFAPLLDVPIVCTVHHEHDPRIAPLYQWRPGVAKLVAVSERQRARSPELESAAVIHHGLSPSRYHLGAGAGGYAAFLGRFARDKGPHHAVDAARAADVPLRLAGRPHADDENFFACELAPRLCRHRAEAIGEVGGDDKTRFLAEASALLFPIDWEEPFGLVMIEAMLCGTPVLAFDCGSVREVVDEGVTGFICRDADEMAARLRAIARRGFDRARCHRRALERWSAARMVADYRRLYLGLEKIYDVRAAAPLP